MAETRDERRDDEREERREEREEIKRDREKIDSFDESVADMNPRTYFDLVSELQDARDDDDRFSKLILDLPRHFRTLYDDREAQKERADRFERKTRELSEANRRLYENVGRTNYGEYDRADRDDRDRFSDFSDEAEDRRVSLDEIRKRK